MSAEKPSRPHANPRDFASTQWSVVLTAGDGKPQHAREALSKLCETYWLPLYAYVRRRVPDDNEAQDLTQAFFAELLEKNVVSAATPQRGSFRAFLLTAFKHFLANQWKMAKAQKRGGGRHALSLDFAAADSSLQIDPAGGLTPEQLYDQQWAIALLTRIMVRLGAEFAEKGKANQFAELKGFLIKDHASATYAQVAPRLHMTEGAAKKAASRMRSRYRQLLRDEIGDTVSGPSEIEEEIRNLFSILEL
jgi:RNA polymerase sigma-70 factor (ECF subfamily)